MGIWHGACQVGFLGGMNGFNWLVVSRLWVWNFFGWNFGVGLA
jgi:hypothetical protein